MGWKIHKTGNVEIHSKNEVAGANILQAFKELWQKFEQHVVPQHDCIEWNVIRVEIWSDSGRIIVYPGLLRNRDRIDKAGCQVIFSDLMETQANLFALKDEDEFETQLEKVEFAYAVKLRESYEQSSLLGSLSSRVSKVLVFSADVEDVLLEWAT